MWVSTTKYFARNVNKGYHTCAIGNAAKNMKFKCRYCSYKIKHILFTGKVGS